MPRLIDIVWGPVHESFDDAKRVFKKRDQVYSISKLDGSLEFFKDLKKRGLIKGQKADIGFWVSQGWQEFDSFLSQMKERSTKRGSKKARWKKASGEVIIHRQDEDVTILTPLSQDAAFCYGTPSWCVATYESFDFTNNLLRNAVLFFILESDGTKWAVRYDPWMKLYNPDNCWSYWDANNNSIQKEQIPYDVEQYLTAEVQEKLEGRKEILLDYFKNNGDINFKNTVFFDLDLRGFKQTNKVIDIFMIKNCDFRKSDFSGTTINNFQGTGSTFDRSNFSNAKLSTVQQMSFKKANFKGAEVNKFHSCDLRGAIFDSATFFSKFGDSGIYDCNLERASFKNVDLTNVTFERTNIEGVDFRGSKVSTKGKDFFGRCHGTPAHWPEGYTPVL
jgi:uncharacterized protein YjbI with pentapeptide repeats